MLSQWMELSHRLETGKFNVRVFLPVLRDGGPNIPVRPLKVVRRPSLHDPTWRDRNESQWAGIELPPPQTYTSNPEVLRS